MKAKRDIRISLFIEDMPDGIHGMVSTYGKDADSYLVCLSNADSPEEQRKSFLHEVLHIYNRDLESGEDAQIIETRTHKQLGEFIISKGQNINAF